MGKINFVDRRSDDFMKQANMVLVHNPWINQIVSAELYHGSLKEVIDHFEDIQDWVANNTEGRYVSVGFSRSYGFELETDIVLFHLTWGKG
jgi:hypothetical protein